MTVGIRIKLAGINQDQFDQIRASVDPDNNPPDGLLYHASGPIDGGWGVIDFWASREQFDRFAQERIGPAVAAVDPPATTAPDIKEFPVYETSQP